MKKWIFAVCLAVPLLLIGVQAEPPREGYELMFADEFDGSELNRQVWNYRNEGYPVRGGVNDPEMVSVSDGNLHIRFEQSDGQYRGGGVITTFGLGYGYYEVRSKLFGGTGGLHSSFWTSGVGGDGVQAPIFNQSIELDFYEVDSNKTASIAPNFHYWLGGHLGGNKNVLKTEDGKNLFTTITNADADYFISGCEYLPDRVIWYINGQKVCEIYDYEMYGRPNVWLTALANTELSGEIDPSKLPGESVWDYFRFYSMPLKGENLVVNPSFDDNNRVDYLTEIEKMKMESPVSWWEIGDQDAISVASGDDLVRTGTGVLQIGKEGAYEAEASQKLQYIGKGDYIFTAYVKNEDGADVEVFAGDKSQKVGKTNGGFEKIVLEDVDVQSGNATVGIRVKGADSYVYVDDVSFACTTGTEEFNRKVPIDPNATTDIPGEVSADNEDENTCVLEGEWLKSSLQGYRGGSVYSNEKDASATWTMEVPADGVYLAQIYKIIYANSVKNAECTLSINGAEKAKESLDLTQGQSGWFTFGNYALQKGDVVTICLKRVAQTSGQDGEYARADGVRLVPDVGLKAQNGLLLKVGKRIAYKDYSKRFIDPDNQTVTPYVNDKDRTLVPLRFIAESLGAEVEYSQTPGILGGNDEIRITLDGKTLLFATGVMSYAVDGVEKQMDTAPENTQDRTFVPLRVLAEAFGKYVAYEESGIISITDEEIEDAAELAVFNTYLYTAE